jgi:hypothetical protein
MHRTEQGRQSGVIKRSLRWIAMAGALALAVTGCASDPTTSDEYGELSAQLASVTAERDALAAANTSIWVELPAEAATALAAYSAAVTSADGQAMLEHVTDTYTFISYGDVTDATAYADWVTRYYANFKVELLGDPMVLGGGDTYIVAEPERVTKPELAEGFSVFRLVQVDGVWLVDEHRFTGE